MGRKKKREVEVRWFERTERKSVRLKRKREEREGDLEER